MDASRKKQIVLPFYRYSFYYRVFLLSESSLCWFISCLLFFFLLSYLNLRLSLDSNKDSDSNRLYFIINILLARSSLWNRIRSLLHLFLPKDHLQWILFSSRHLNYQINGGGHHFVSCGIQKVNCKLISLAMKILNFASLNFSKLLLFFQFIYFQWCLTSFLRMNW